MYDAQLSHLKMLKRQSSRVHTHIPRAKADKNMDGSGSVLFM